jgi:hypothetical protein
MKLYATIQSERAKKGQGGNELLVIKITRQIVKPTISEIAEIEVKPDGHIDFYYNSNLCNVNLIPWKLKGKKQKGD